MLVNEIKQEITLILQGATANNDMTDDIVDELGDYYDDVYNSNNTVLQDAYSLVRDSADEAIHVQVAAATAALMLLHSYTLVN